MDKPFYPNVSDSTVLQLTAIQGQMERNKDYLNHPDCPYSQTVKDFLRRASAPAPAGPSETIDYDPEDDKLEYLEKQIRKLIADLDAFEQKLATGDHSERLQYLKSKTGLIEKLVNSQERLFNVKNYADFQARMLIFLDEICSKDQVTELKERLRGLINEG